MCVYVPRHGAPHVVHVCCCARCACMCVYARTMLCLRMCVDAVVCVFRVATALTHVSSVGEIRRCLRTDTQPAQPTSEVLHLTRLPVSLLILDGVLEDRPLPLGVDPVAGLEAGPAQSHKFHGRGY